MSQQPSPGASVVSIVLVTWNSAPFLPRCLEGLASQNWSARELIVVDNASSDRSLEIVRERFPNARCIGNDANEGFARAVNQGIAAARGEFVLLCNPDAFLERDYVTRLVDALEQAGEPFGMATGKLLRGEGHAIAPTNIIDTLGIEMRRTGRHFDMRQGERDDGAETAPFEVFGVSGAAAMYRMSFLRDVAIDGEIFDEDFHTYREDADLAWRGRVLGWRAISVPAAKGYHVRTVTPGNRRALSAAVNMHSVKNRFLLRLKNESLLLALRNAPFELARDLVAIAAVLTVERSSLPAFGWLWKNRRRVLAKRRQIQSRRRVSDRELARWFR